MPSSSQDESYRGQTFPWRRLRSGLIIRGSRAPITIFSQRPRRQSSMVATDGTMRQRLLVRFTAQRPCDAGPPFCLLKPMPGPSSNKRGYQCRFALESGHFVAARYRSRWAMYGRRPRCKRNLMFCEAFGCSHVYGLFSPGGLPPSRCSRLAAGPDVIR